MENQPPIQPNNNASAKTDDPFAGDISDSEIGRAKPKRGFFSPQAIAFFTQEEHADRWRRYMDRPGLCRYLAKEYVRRYNSNAITIELERDRKAAAKRAPAAAGETASSNSNDLQSNATNARQAGFEAGTEDKKAQEKGMALLSKHIYGWMERHFRHGSSDKVTAAVQAILAKLMLLGKRRPKMRSALDMFLDENKQTVDRDFDQQYTGRAIHRIGALMAYRRDQFDLLTEKEQDHYAQKATEDFESKRVVSSYDDVYDENRSAKDYAEAFDMHERILSAFVDALSQFFGMSATVYLTGPTFMSMGAIDVVSVSSACYEFSKTQRMWGEYDPKLYETLQRSLMQYGADVFPPEQCELRKLIDVNPGLQKGLIPLSDSDEDSDSGGMDVDTNSLGPVVPAGKENKQPKQSKVAALQKTDDAVHPPAKKTTKSKARIKKSVAFASSTGAEAGPSTHATAISSNPPVPSDTNEGSISSIPAPSLHSPNPGVSNDDPTVHPSTVDQPSLGASPASGSPLGSAPFSQPVPPPGLGIPPVTPGLRTSSQPTLAPGLAIPSHSTSPQGLGAPSPLAATAGLGLSSRPTSTPGLAIPSHPTSPPGLGVPSPLALTPGLGLPSQPTSSPGLAPAAVPPFMPNANHNHVGDRSHLLSPSESDEAFAYQQRISQMPYVGNSLQPDHYYHQQQPSQQTNPYQLMNGGDLFPQMNAHQLSNEGQPDANGYKSLNNNNPSHMNGSHPYPPLNVNGQPHLNGSRPHANTPQPIIGGQSYMNDYRLINSNLHIEGHFQPRPSSRLMNANQPQTVTFSTTNGNQFRMPEYPRQQLMSPRPPPQHEWHMGSEFDFAGFHDYLGVSNSGIATSYPAVPPIPSPVPSSSQQQAQIPVPCELRVFSPPIPQPGQRMVPAQFPSQFPGHSSVLHPVYHPQPLQAPPVSPVVPSISVEDSGQTPINTGSPQLSTVQGQAIVNARPPQPPTTTAQTPINIGPQPSTVQGQSSINVGPMMQEQTSINVESPQPPTTPGQTSMNVEPPQPLMPSQSNVPQSALQLPPQLPLVTPSPQSLPAPAQLPPLAPYPGQQMGVTQPSSQLPGHSAIPPTVLHPQLLQPAPLVAPSNYAPEQLPINAESSRPSTMPSQNNPVQSAPSLPAVPLTAPTNVSPDTGVAPPIAPSVLSHIDSPPPIPQLPNPRSPPTQSPNQTPSSNTGTTAPRDERVTMDDDVPESQPVPPKKALRDGLDASNILPGKRKREPSNKANQGEEETLDPLQKAGTKKRNTGRGRGNGRGRANNPWVPPS